MIGKTISQYKIVEKLGEGGVNSGVSSQMADFDSRYGTLGRSFATDGSYIYFSLVENSGDIWVMDVVQ